MYRRSSYAVVALVGAATLITGCGSSSSGGSSSGGGGSTSSGGGSNNSSQAPSAELSSAVAALGNASTLTATIKLGATGSQISSLASSHGSSLTSTEANAIAGIGLNVEVSAPSGKTLSSVGTDSAGEAVDFSISDNGTNYLSFRVVKQVLYIQADVKDLLSTLGESQVLAGIQAESAQLPAFVQALLDGKWVSLPESTLKSLTGSLGTTTPSSPSSAQESQFLAALQGILTKDVTVTRTSSGSTDNLTITGNARTIGTDLVTQLQSVVPGGGAALGSTNPSSIPSKNITLTAQVTGGALSQLTIDLGQFGKGKAFSLPLELTFTRGGAAISAPSGAVQVDTSQLGSLVGGLGGLG